ncbi:MAG TPA: hypothetical protein VG733_12865 [Chthoniobacteraceae bacterium]|nr:hypothetical protein [Chthoniobacteraceae bacterium]
MTTTDFITAFPWLLAQTVNTNSAAYKTGALFGRVFLVLFVIIVLMRVARRSRENAGVDTPAAPRAAKAKQASSPAPQGAHAKARVVGLCLLLGGAVLIFIAQWAVRAHGAFVLAADAGAEWSSPARWGFDLIRLLAAMAPALAGAGLALLAFGAARAAFTAASLLALTGLAAGVMFAAGMRPSRANAVHDALACCLDPALARVGLVRPIVDRRQLDAAVADSRAASDQIARRQRTVNRADKAALAALEKDTEACNTRIKDVQQMYNDYMAGPAATGALVKQLSGTWKQVQDPAAGVVRTFTIAFNAGSDVHIETAKDFTAAAPVSLPAPGHDTDTTTAVSASVDGKWALYGNSLALRTPAVTGDLLQTDGAELWTIETLDDKTLTVTTPHGKKTFAKAP